MKPEQSLLAGDAHEEITALIATLIATEHRLEELTEGEVDSVADNEGRTFLLRRAQEELRYCAAAKQSAILNELRVLFDIVPVMIWFKNTENGYLRVNRRAAETFGMSVEEMEGMSAYEIFPEEAAGYYADDLEVIRTGASKIGMIEKVCRPKGHEFWVQTDKLPVFDLDSKVIGIVVMSQDITERTQAEETRARLAAIVESSDDAIIGKTLDGLITSWNAGAQRLLGYRADEIVGRPIATIIPADYRDEGREILACLRREERLEHFETVRVAKDGRRIPVSLSISPVRDAAGRTIGASKIARDITERKHSEAELLEATRQAGMAEVATSVLHNVGNVLNSVTVASSCLADRLRRSKSASLSKVATMLHEHAADLGGFLTSDPKGKLLPGYFGQLAEHLATEQEAALKELAGLQKNIEHIKEIVAMQQSCGNISGVRETLKITDVMEDALRMNAEALTRYDIQTIREYEEVPRATIDKHKVLQILMNLIRNAKHAYDGSGSVNKRLTVRVANGDQRVRISISDNGIGIPAENLTRIFNHGFTTKKDGHGYGLHSAALAAKAMGGSLSVHSDGSGKGAVFTLELPIDQESSAKSNAA